MCRIITAHKRADGQKKVEFSLPTAESPLTSDEPYWANYVKGVVQFFDGKDEIDTET